MSSGSAPLMRGDPVAPDGADQKDAWPDQPVEDDGIKRGLAGRYR